MHRDTRETWTVLGLMLMLLAVFLFLATNSGCTDLPDEPTQEFGDVVECDEETVFVAQGVRGTERRKFEAQCLPKCNREPGAQLCPERSVFWTIPVKITDEYPSGNLCFCMGE